ncbi:hypothetical protein GCM10011339_28230 [Echinicola rosea]|uniref:DUF5648 domain-containing protein n=2 Tax=Echinicola rosea TaxID=1807691 RepID=A0ABQ1V5Y6_9BACT|nr:hypothetical protein GCM10011339_28230 [Echinicola rosea]
MEGENASTNCSEQTITVTKCFSSLTLLEKGTDGLIYPGSLLTAESVLSGDYKEILGVTKRPLNIVFDIRGMTGAKNKWIEPTYSNYVNALGEMEAKPISGSQPAYVNFTTSEVKSEEHLKVAVGANFGVWKFSNISTDFKLDQERTKTVTVGKFVQEYFTVTADRPSDGVYIEEYPDPSIFGSYSPMYVSELTYGRVALFFAESTHSSDSVGAALEASFNFLANGSGNVSTAQKNILNTSRIKTLIHGGSSGDAAYVFVNGYEGLKDYVSQGGEMTNDSRGAIISYKLRNLSTHYTGTINISADYEERECKVEVFSYWSDGAKDHFYRTSYSPTAGGGNWSVEGRVFYGVPADREDAKPVYQYWNGTGQDHLYTFDNQPSIGAWQREYIAFYAFDTKVPGTQPVYSYYNSDAADHYYNFDVGSTAGGGGKWKREHVAFYAYP